MRVGSLFTGYGGLDLAVEAWTGGTTVWQCEVEPAAAAILTARWPGVPNLGDITQVDWAEVPPVDVLTGGFPCQDLSTAGIRRGLRPGTRSGLWQYMAAAARQLRPGTVVIENVRGILSAEAHSDLERDCWCLGDTGDPALRALGAVLGDLADLGFHARWGTVPASAAGAPHRRERVFVVATHPGRGQLARTAGERGLPVTRQRGADRIEASIRLLPTPVVNDMGAKKTPEEWDEWTAAMRGRHGNGNGHGPSLAIEAQRLMSTPTVGLSTGGGQRSHRFNAGNGSQRTHNPKELAADIGAGRLTGFGPYEAAVQRWEAVLGRPAPPPAHAGRLNPVFVEWLMGLPEGWVTDPALHLTRTQQLKALGNGVVPQQAHLALRLINQQEAR